MATIDYCAQPNLLPIDDAIVQMLAQLNAPSNHEQCNLLDALDRVIAEDIYAPINVPAYDNSAMDGYALNWDTSTSTNKFTIVGQCLAGQFVDTPLQAGEALRIMTGAPLPPCATAVVMQENTQVTNNQLDVFKPPKANENIRRAGEDIAQGTLILKKGHKLKALDIALLASIGIHQCKVYSRLKVAIFSTGDELTPPGQPLAPGHIYDSNRYGLISLLKRWPVDIIDLGLISDSPEEIEAVFEAAANTADVIISSGGVSVGDADFTKSILEKLGQIHFWKIAMKPGKPFAFGRLGKAHFFGLPGNPVSAVVTFHQLVMPALHKLTGQEIDYLNDKLVSAKTLDPLKKQKGRQDFQRGIYEITPEGLVVKSAGLQSSGVLSALTKANCYIVLPIDQGNLAAGEQVNILPFDQALN